MTESQQEKKNQRIALISTIGVHAVVLLLLFFIIAWRAPNPPLPEYGIELNFGLDNQGSGEVQPETPVGSEGTQEEEPQTSEPLEEPQPEETKSTETTESKPAESKAQEEVVSKVESPVKAREVKEETKTVEKTKAESKPVETKKETETKPKEDPKTVYKPNTQNTESTNKTTEGKTGTTGNHGDDKDKAGDKGNPEGSLDAKALYGKPGGGGGGSSLDLAGWNWDEIPKPNVPNNETGRIVFEIVVNSDGELERITAIENSLSPEAAKACREAVERLTFTKTGTNVPALSKGKITFVVRAK